MRPPQLEVDQFLRDWNFSVISPIPRCATKGSRSVKGLRVRPTTVGLSMIWAWMFGEGLKQVFTFGRLRSVYDLASPLNALTRWRRNAALDPILE